MAPPAPTATTTLPLRPHAADTASVSGSDSSSSSGGEETWQDAEIEEEEPVSVVSLVDDQVFSSVAAMLEHCRTSAAGLDFLALRKSLKLDFLGCVKLINFLRSSKKPLASKAVTREDLEDDKWLKPVLEDDALIMGLGDLVGDEEDEELEGEEVAAAAGETDSAEELRAKNKALLAEVKLLRRQFDDYRVAVAETLDARWEANSPTTTTGATTTTTTTTTSASKDESEYYWNSYAGNEIHETMLKDTVRTDAYRDFIYTHKDVFKGKVVLDVGCGTGILSMFCARAGAARVIAVDKSNIIQKARENIFANGLHDVITTLHGAIEELTLPVDKVDVIVSEWMGYALLYEAMLPSVLYARDKWLSPGGLLVPSTATLWIAPFADEEYIMDNFAFWRNVYGFDMQPMQTGIFDECRESVVPPSAACAPAHQFLRLDLQTIRAEDLSFTAKWASTLSRHVDALDGFLVWFDIFFTRTPDNSAVVDGTTAQEWAGQDPAGGNVAFTTGPAGKATHWMQTVYVIKPEEGDGEKKKTEIKEGTEIGGEITYAVLEGDKSARALSVDVAWAVGGGEKRTQRWKVQ